MIILGLGLGLLFSQSSCARKKRPSENQERAPESAPRHHSGRREQEAPKEKQTETSTEKSGATEKQPSAPRESGRAQGPAEPAHVEPSLPKFALVIDDLGYARPEWVTRLCAQPVAFSVAVLPFQEFTKESAEIAYERGKEVMLHLPMEPIGYPAPGKDPGSNAILFNMKEADIRARVRAALDAIPHRKGVNNHMGSRITPDTARMTWILQEIKARRCFFLDSRTEKNSVAFDVAERLGVPSVQRKVFLDDDKAYPEMEKQWDRAIALAKKEGQVVIIGHIYPETVAALEKLIPRAKGQVRFVKAGELVR
ncbi:MAG TPA: divergent polysaccharide deacetylase family protein [Holophaga sp.]|jgi:polysaccharide deacetylase 2 family uncharacterized protein YibQ|nr:divergent polysaccharide deacetylase family protein [Holophaga sp.]